MSVSGRVAIQTNTRFWRAVEDSVAESAEAFQNEGQVINGLADLFANLLSGR